MSKYKVDYNKILKARNEFGGFLRTVGFRLTAIDHLYAKAEIELKDMHKNPMGSAHGGVAFTLADTVGGACANTMGMTCITISGDIHYLSPAMNCEHLIGEATPIKVGKRLAVIQVMLTNELGREIAMATMTYQFMPELPFPFESALIKDGE